MFNQLAKKVTIFVALSTGTVFGQIEESSPKCGSYGPHCAACSEQFNQCGKPCGDCDWNQKWCRDCWINCNEQYQMCCTVVFYHQHRTFSSIKIEEKKLKKW